jgi:probable O-glycosylation ligase (exosortase A-associated)
MAAPDQGVAWRYVEGLSKIVLPFVVGMTIINSVERLKALTWVIVLSEGYVAFEFNLSYLSGFNRLWLLGFGGMDNNSNAIALDSCLGLAFFLAVAAERWWQRAAALMALALMTHAVLFSFSRGGMLGMIISGVVIFLLMPKRPAICVCFAVAVLVAVRLAGPDVIARFSTVFADSNSRDSSAESRLVLWSNCLDALSKHPIFGLGPDHWPLNAASYGWPAGKEAHTLWLTIAAELGVPGLLFLASCYAICMLRVWPLTRENHDVPDPWIRELSRMVIASLVGFAVAAQFVSLDMLEIPYYIALIGACVLKLSSMPADAPADSLASVGQQDG